MPRGNPFIDYDRFPTQGDTLGEGVAVGYQIPDNGIDYQHGTVVRDDLDMPLVTIVKLDDEKIVLGDELDRYTPVKQGPFLHENAGVSFNDEYTRQEEGKIVRNDAEPPYKTVIELTTGKNAGRLVLNDECQYSPDSLRFRR